MALASRNDGVTAAVGDGRPEVCARHEVRSCERSERQFAFAFRPAPSRTAAALLKAKHNINYFDAELNDCVTDGAGEGRA